MKKYGIFVLLFAIIILSGCNSASINNKDIVENSNMKIDEVKAQELMDQGAVILDVRTQDEYDEGHIENAVLIPDYEIETVLEEINDKNQVILVYCRSGRRSAAAAQKLVDMGYTKVYDFGGIETDWTGKVVTD